jgi:hypothetical protein
MTTEGFWSWWQAYGEFWEQNKYTKYFEHKTDSYKNGRRKIYEYNKGLLFMETPYRDGNVFGFGRGEPKEVDEETLTKYFKEIPRGEFFEKQITHIPT